MVSRFDKKYWTINEWRSDKYTDGHYAESNKNPDLELTLKARGQQYKIAVECKYRSHFNDEKLKWSYPDQVKRYKAFAKEKGIPTFIIIGVGGTAANPELVYIVPIQNMPGDEVTSKFLLKYRRKTVGKNFYYDGPSNKLSLWESNKENSLSIQSETIS